MAQDDTDRPDDGAAAPYEPGKPGPAPNADPTQTYPTEYGQQNTPGTGYAPPGYDPRSGYGQQSYYPQPGYPPPPTGMYGPPAGYAPYPPAAPPTNTMAILALVLAFVFAPLGIVFGIIARNQIARTGEGGDGLALAGIIVGGIFTALLVLYIIFMIVFFSAMFSAIPYQS
jgi:Domain of unknown function (DUF4190)